MTKEKLYLTVYKETELLDQFIHELTGNVIIDVYEMVDNVPVKLFQLECTLNINPINAVQNHLDDNGMGDTLYEFILL